MSTITKSNIQDKSICSLLSNEQIYCQILTNYYQLGLPFILKSPKSELYLYLLHRDYMSGFLRGENGDVICNQLSAEEITRCVYLCQDKFWNSIELISRVRLNDKSIIFMEYDPGKVHYFSTNWIYLYHYNDPAEISTWTDRNYDLKNMSYSSYLQTLEWKEKRLRALEKAKYKCQLCNCDTNPLHIHHKTYIRRGNEHPNDLIALCDSCHAMFDHKLIDPSKEGGAS